MPLLHAVERQLASRCRMRLRLLVAVLSFVAAGGQEFGRTAAGKPVCKDGVWTEVPEALVLAYAVTPRVQCWRKPAPCIRWNYLTQTKCKQLTNDEDFPTADPYLNTSDAMPTIRDVFSRFFANKTVFFVGDSINNQVFMAAECELLRWGLSIEYGRLTSTSSLPAPLAARARAHWRSMARLTRLHDAVGGGEARPGFWDPEGPGGPRVILETETLLVQKGWHKWKKSDMVGMLSLAGATTLFPHSFFF